MRKLVKRIVLILGLGIAFLLLCGVTKVKAAGSPVIEIKKDDYNEADNTITVGVYLKGGVSLKSYNFTMKYKSTDIENVSINENITSTYPYPETPSYGSGEFTITSDKCLTTAVDVTEDEQICRITFKVVGATVLEEDTKLNQLFEIGRIIIEDDADEYYDKNLIKVNDMAKTVSSIALADATFDKTPYVHGDQINLTGGTVTINYENASESGATRIVTLGQDASGNYRWQDNNGNNIGIEADNLIADFNNKKINVAYKGINSNEVDVDVIDKIESIKLIAPTKTVYEYNENLDLTGAKILIKMASKNTADEILLDELQNDNRATISGFDSTLGPKEIITQTVTVNIPEYSFTDNFEVTIEDKIKEIKFVAPTKKEYEYQESSLDLRGGKIIIEMLSGEEIERNLTLIPKVNTEGVLRNLRTAINIIDEVEITGFDGTQYGVQTITVKYYYEENGVRKEKTFTYEINIKSGIVSTELNKDKITIQYGYEITDEDLKNENVKIVITKTDSTTEEIQVTVDMLTYNKKGNIGIQIGYVTYNGKQLPISIELTNYVSYIKLSKDIVTIMYGNELDENTLTDEYKIIPVMANGEEGTSVKLTKEKIVGIYDINQEGIYNVKVKYIGKETNFKIEIIDPIIDIKLEEEQKDKIEKEYKYDEELKLNDAKLTLVKLSGETQIDLLKEMIENYNAKEIGLQKINISYSGKRIEEAFEVEVKDYIVDIVLVKPSKTEYLQGQKLDLTGATVRTLSASGKLRR